jgi:hypothetical protein
MLQSYEFEALEPSWADQQRALTASRPLFPAPIPDARREGPRGPAVPASDRALADLARQLSLSARHRTAGA